MKKKSEGIYKYFYASYLLEGKHEDSLYVKEELSQYPPQTRHMKTNQSTKSSRTVT